MVMLRFEPNNTALVGSLVTSSKDVIKDETLILDASGSFISNVPQNV
jgi:hypothetical protein